jgi:hypothetical protein
MAMWFATSKLLRGDETLAGSDNRNGNLGSHAPALGAWSHGLSSAGLDPRDASAPGILDRGRFAPHRPRRTRPAMAP